MESFGQQLRRAREAQNISLQEIAATTKISSRALQAMESDHFERLPGGVFNKGFVRAYARCVGLDEEKMLAAYMAAAQPDAETDMQTISSQIAAAKGPVKESRIGGTTVMGVLALIVALGLGAVWLREQRKEAREQADIPAAPAATPVATAPAQAAPAPAAPTPDAGAGEAAGANPTGETSPGPGEAAAGAAAKTAVGAAPSAALNAALNAPPNPTANAAPKNANPNTATNVAPKANPAANSGVAPNLQQNSTLNSTLNSTQDATHDAAASEGKPAPVEVSISATQPAWISVLRDGKAVESLTLDPHKPELRSRSYKAKQRLKLTVGNAAGVSVSYNGKPLGSLGSAGKRETFTFTPRGMEKR